MLRRLPVGLVIEHGPGASEVVFGERRLDRRLADGQPVDSGAELVLIDHAEAELLAQAGAGGVRRQCAGGGELGARNQQAADDQGQDQIATAVAIWAQQATEADLARGAERGGDMELIAEPRIRPPAHRAMRLAALRQQHIHKASCG